MEENKKALLSGKLSGTRTFSSELAQIENPDEVEKFLLYFSTLNIDYTNLKATNVNYINSNEDLQEYNEKISNCNYISLYHTEDFSKLYLTTDSKETLVINLNKISPAIIANFISKEEPIKFAINSFNFIKWCNSKNIDIKNLFDIPTYIKLLTNDVDPFKTIESYIKDYTNYTLDETEIELNNIIISNFIYEFGITLAEYINKFDLTTVSRLINENSYYEGNTFNNTGNCIIKISYTNTDDAINNILEKVLANFKNNAYIISPLNRIAPKFKRDTRNLVYEIYSEDLSITILNELYNNNIPVKFDYESNQYIITCKYKNYINILNLLNAIFYDTFFTIFDQTPEMNIECNIKE